jgi:hypothetical protein
MVVIEVMEFMIYFLNFIVTTCHMKLLEDAAGCTQATSPSSYVLGTALKHKQAFLSAQ